MRFKKFGNYKLDKYIFRTTTIIIFIFLFSVIVFQGLNPSIYVECEGELYCDNPYIMYGICKFTLEQQIENVMYRNICSMEVIPKGETLGKKPIINNTDIYSITGLIFLAGFILNHSKYNRRRKWNKQELKLIQRGLKKHFTKSIKKKGKREGKF